MKLRFWEVLDTAGHRWKLPWRKRICDQYNQALGLTETGTRRTTPDG